MGRHWEICRENNDSTRFLSSGVPGLDNILAGGLTRDRLYLVEGEPGTGKTTLALQFLNEGKRQGESVLYITLAETTIELSSVAQSHGWTLDGIHIEEIIPDQASLDPDQQYSIFHPSEIELGTTTQRILVRSVAHGVVTLELASQSYGSERRRLRVVKYRGIAFRGGSHDYRILYGGLHVFPRLVAADTRVSSTRRQLSSGLRAMDDLLGGGLEEGMSTLVAGPPGSGKSTVAAQFVSAACQRGERA
eukprot:gene34786-39330_t